MFVWNKLVLCSLVLRIFYGEELSFIKVNKVNEVEKFILSLGINYVWVCYYYNIVCIEVIED